MAVSRMHNKTHPGEVCKDGWKESVTLAGPAGDLRADMAVENCGLRPFPAPNPAMAVPLEFRSFACQVGFWGECCV